jgi:arabinose-5-phosphate isomerase
MTSSSKSPPLSDTINVLDEIDRVFQLEIDTLLKVRRSLGEPYAKAIDLLFNCTGSIVVTGMGKSGLIAQKIAATLVSTGTAAVFLHPGDGMHGDVGIVKRDDVVLTISKSGETEELLSILLYVRSLGVPVISITANEHSALAHNSEVVLLTPVDVEACPLNLAPTSSTTAALVVGDALAMTLMKLRGFQPENFALRHPGGRLGKQLLMTVEDVMLSGDNNPIIYLEDTVHRMLIEISSKRCGAVSVVGEQSNLLGLVTDFDVRNILELKQDLFSLKIVDIMNPNPTYVYSNEKAFKALEVMRNRENPFLVLPALDRLSSKVVGMVHLHHLVAVGL